jgi:hypothetical protein
MRALFSADGVGYMSAGFGDGPWHVDIGRNLEQIQDGSLDLVVLDDPSGLGEDHELLLAGLSSKISATGCLAIVPDQSAWPRPGDLGFRFSSEEQGWVLYDPPGAAGTTAG